MESPESRSEAARERLIEVRKTLLVLHKALLDSERTAYEIVHGPIASPAAFLQLLINDDRFAWLRPMTSLVVEIDETLASKKRGTPQDFERLVNDTRALLSPSREANGFWQRYSGVMQRDPGVAVVHAEIEKQLA